MRSHGSGGEEAEAVEEEAEAVQTLQAETPGMDAAE